MESVLLNYFEFIPEELIYIVCLYMEPDDTIKYISDKTSGIYDKYLYDLKEGNIINFKRYTVNTMQVFSNRYSAISSSFIQGEYLPIESFGTSSPKYILFILDFLNFPMQELEYIYYLRFDSSKSITILLYQKKNLVNGIIIAIHGSEFGEDEIDQKYSTSIKSLDKYEGNNWKQGWSQLPQDVKNDILKQNGYNY